MTALVTQGLRSYTAMSWPAILALGREFTGAPNVHGHFMLAHGEYVGDVLGKRGWSKAATERHDELHADAEHLMLRPHRHKED